MYGSTIYSRVEKLLEKSHTLINLLLELLGRTWHNFASVLRGISVELQKFTKIELRGLEDLHFTDKDVLQRVNSLASLLNLFSLDT
jgi:hypothetical protein